MGNEINGNGYQTEHIDCYYIVRGQCYHRGSPHLRCSVQIAVTCEQRSKDVKTLIHWKERYWKLMQALREKVAK